MDKPGESGLETFLLDSAERSRRNWRLVPTVLAALAAACLLLGWYWGRPPTAPDAGALVRAAGERGQVPGAASTLTLQAIVRTLLEKPGGYLANDRLPPGVLMDDMPSFELGALVHVRDMSRALRRDFSRSVLQSVDDPDLLRAEPSFNFRHDSWLVPSSEGEYQAGVDSLDRYFQRLTDPDAPGAHFFARADNLARWLEDVGQRLDGYVQRLGAAVEQRAVPPAGPGAAGNTPWSQIDNEFFEARGYCWALRAQLAAVQVDFSATLAERGAVESVAAIIRELEGTQRPIKSPLILNGSEYGMLANHSLVMAGYVARAHAGILVLRGQLGKG